jgi:hypothetical protein
LLAVERALGDRNPLQRLPAFAQMLVTFFITTQLWVFFRAPTWNVALTTFSALYGELGRASLVSSEHGPLALLTMAIGAGIVLLPRNSNQPTPEPSLRRSATLVLGFALCVLFTYGSVSHPFLYFQF